MDETPEKPCFCDEGYKEYQASSWDYPGVFPATVEKLLPTLDETRRWREDGDLDERVAYRCRVCGQVWQTDIFDKGHVYFEYFRPELRDGDALPEDHRPRYR